MDRVQLWQRLRLSVEIGFAVDEMLREITSVSADAAFRSMAHLRRQDLS
jgi:hypothetical protein